MKSPHYNNQNQFISLLEVQGLGLVLYDMWVYA